MHDDDCAELAAVLVHNRAPINDTVPRMAGIADDQDLQIGYLFAGKRPHQRMLGSIKLTGTVGSVEDKVARPVVRRHLAAFYPMKLACRCIDQCQAAVGIAGKNALFKAVQYRCRKAPIKVQRDTADDIFMLGAMNLEYEENDRKCSCDIEPDSFTELL